MTDRLLAAAARVDVIETAGRIIANPKRNAIGASAAEVLALAHAAEKFWAVALHADFLTRAVDVPPTGNAEQDANREQDVASHANEIKRLMAALRGDKSNEETI